MRNPYLPGFRSARVAGLLGLALYSLTLSGTEPPAGTPRNPGISAGFISFAHPFHPIELELDSDALDHLRRDPRQDVAGMLWVSDHTASPVQVHLKGSTGSFRAVDDRPSLTITRSSDDPPQRFHLENSVEDPGLLHQWLGSELFREAGIPTPRVAHARLKLNGRNLGLYVIREGYGEDFMERGFGPGSGGIGEPGPGQDIGGHWTFKRRTPPLNSPGAEEATAALAALNAACHEADPARRWTALSARLDTHRFATLLAGEVLLEHRDGYGLARNNYRVHWEARSGRLTLLPHGMDQLFVESGFTRQPQMAGSVARAFLETAPGRQAYAERWEQLTHRWMNAARLTDRLTVKIGELNPHLTPPERRAFQAESEDLIRRIRRRCEQVATQHQEPWPSTARFEDGTLRLAHWTPLHPPEGGALTEQREPESNPRLRILAGPVTAASWQTRVLLPAGRYRLEGRAGMRGFRPLPFGQQQGAALRVSGDRPRSAALTNHAAGVPLSVTFEVAQPEEEIRIHCELRASSGQADFEKESLRVLRLE